MVNEDWDKMEESEVINFTNILFYNQKEYLSL